MGTGIKHFSRNLLFLSCSQFLSIFVGISTSLLVPKILGVEQFSFWQLFLFCASYVGFFHFGLNDGIYLRYGGMTFEKMNISLLGSLFWFSFFMQICFALLIVVITVVFVPNLDRVFVGISVSFFLILSNVVNYLSYILQTSNRLREYSYSILIDRFTFFLFFLFLLLVNQINFKILILAYIFSKLLSFLFLIYCMPSLVRSKLLPVNVIWRECIYNIKIGVFLLISNLAGMFIVGAGRVIIDYFWGIEEFGKVSLAISLANIFLLFISQISLVLFPMLRQVDAVKQKEIYMLGRYCLGNILLFFFILYYPLKIILLKWLPQYEISFYYLIILLPICLFDGKMQMLYSTYLKVLRGEKFLLKINVVSVLISSILGLLGGYLWNNMDVVIFSMLLAVAVRSVCAELYVSKLLGVTDYWELFAELSLVMTFVITSLCCVYPWNIIIYICVYLVYVWFRKDAIYLIFCRVCKFFQK
jgi:heteropolysaccharide repeat-containing protein